MIKNINEIKMFLWICFINLNDTIPKLNFKRLTFIVETDIFDQQLLDVLCSQINAIQKGNSLV